MKAASAVSETSLRFPILTEAICLLAISSSSVRRDTPSRNAAISRLCKSGLVCNSADGIVKSFPAKMILLRGALWSRIGHLIKRYRMTMDKATIQYHAQNYIGNPRVLAVIQWLNARPRNRAKSDPVEQLIRVNADEWRAGVDINAVTKKVRSILRRSKLRLTPFWYVPVVHITRFSKRRGELVPRTITDWRRWGIEWDATAKGMGLAQSLALRSVLDLASEGLLEKVRKCDREGCGEWFYARKRHQRFHSTDCQQWTLRHDKDWMDKHAAVMRARRAAAKAKKLAQKSSGKKKGKR
jgi:hypothetical protein